MADELGGGAGTGAVGVRRRDGGFTFVETVLTIVLLGVIVIPVLAAVRSAVKTSSVADSAAQVETVLINAADRVRRAPNSGAEACDFTAHAVAAGTSAGWPAGSISVRQEYLEGDRWVTGPGTGPACPETGHQARLGKRITITATSPDGEVTRTMQVVKSDV